MIRNLDCVVAGSCVVDLLCTPVHLDRPIGKGVLHDAQPVILTGGGITSNSGITLARLGLRTAVFSFVGRDPWAQVVRNLHQSNGLDTDHLIEHPTAATSTTFVAIDPSGERSFFHCVGAHKLMVASDFLSRMDLWQRTRMLLLGYYSLMPNLENDLPAVFKEIRAAGCQTALDAAGSGGTMSPLDRILPHLDVYVPSMNEAMHQTGLDDGEKIIACYRACGAPGILGVKLGGTRGVLLSPKTGELIHCPSAAPPGPVLDTTGAGDSFYAGLLAGILKGLSLEAAGKLGTAAAACCVTALGGSTAARSYADLLPIAGLNP
jgi:sugar/nucleoside kinase (ribokinase family)